MIGAANRAIAWVETHAACSRGATGKPVRLREWQKDERGKIYDNPHGTRRTILSFGHKNVRQVCVNQHGRDHRVDGMPWSLSNSAMARNDSARLASALSVTVASGDSPRVENAQWTLRRDCGGIAHRQKSLKRWGDNSVYRTVCWMLRCPM